MMRLLMVLALVAAVRGAIEPRVHYFDGRLVETRAEAIEYCTSIGHCIAHESQLLADLADNYLGHRQCGFVWSHDSKPRHAHCLVRDGDKCLKAQLRNNNCLKEDKFHGTYCRVERPGEDLDHPCIINDMDLIELFRLKGPFKNVPEARAACEGHGSQLAYWTQVAAYAERYGVGFCQYDILRVDYGVYQINCGRDGDIKYRVLNSQSNGYGAICRGMRPHGYHDPCADKYSTFNGAKLYCDKDEIVFQARPACVDETMTFDASARDWEEWKYGFGIMGSGYWLGLDYVHKLTEEHQCGLTIEIWDHEDNYYWARYGSIVVRGENPDSESCSSYKLELDDYDITSTAGDALREGHYTASTDSGSYFSARGKDCDAEKNFDCSKEFHSAWWFGSCHRGNLNGICDDKPEYDPSASKDRFWDPINGVGKANRVPKGLRKTVMKLKCVEQS